MCALFIQGGSHLYNSLYGVDSTSTFTAGPGSKFLLYDNETDSLWGAFWFANITLNNVESFVVLNASGRAIGNRSNTNNLAVNGVSSIRYYPSGQISNLFNSGTYAYTPARSPDSWWANTSPFGVTAAGWANAASPTLTNNTYSSANVPSSTVTVQTTLTSGNFRQYGAAAYGVEIYSTIGTVTYDRNGANAGTVPAGDAGVPNDLITIKDNTGSLARPDYEFAGWNTAANGTGTTYRTGDTFRITKDTILYAQWVPGKYTVTEKYVDELTGSGFGQNDTYAAGTTSPYNYSYDGSPEDITVGSDTYTYIGYKVGDYSPGDVLEVSGAPEVSGLTADAAVYLIYHKITGTIDVTFPTGSSWEFYVNQDTYTYVETDHQQG